jgi:hypothetical protein
VVFDSKYDWYQNMTHTFVSFKIKKGDIRNLVEVEYGTDHVVITYCGRELAHLYLSNFISQSESDYKCSTKKLELCLKKTAVNINWA